MNLIGNLFLPYSDTADVQGLSDYIVILYTKGPLVRARVIFVMHIGRVCVRGTVCRAYMLCGVC